jgi:hypothetical protein
LRMIRYYSSSSGLHSILLSLWSSTSLLQAQAIKLTTTTTRSIPLKLRLNIYTNPGASWSSNPPIKTLRIWSENSGGFFFFFFFQFCDVATKRVPIYTGPGKNWSPTF